MTGGSRLALARHELRRAGPAALLTPPGVLLAGVVMVVLAASSGGAYHQVAGTVLEALLPLAAGIASSGVLTTDSAVELQLSLPVPYRQTLARRVLLTLGGAAGLSGAAAVLAAAAGLWTSPHGPWAGQLTWLAPAVALGGVGVLLAALSVNAAFAGGAVAGIWVGEQSYKPWFATHSWAHPLFLFPDTRRGVVPVGDWVANRLTLLAVGLGALAVAWVVLTHTERLLSGDGRSAVLSRRVARPRDDRPRRAAVVAAAPRPSQKGRL